MRYPYGVKPRTHCNTLQHTATRYNTLQHNATHCYTLLHTATDCNTLQQTATDLKVDQRSKADELDEHFEGEEKREEEVDTLEFALKCAPPVAATYRGKLQIYIESVADVFRDSCSKV